MQRGWKRRQSVEDIDRSKWDGKNQLSDLVESMFFDSLAKSHSIEDWGRCEIPGEFNANFMQTLRFQTFIGCQK